MDAENLSERLAAAVNESDVCVACEAILAGAVPNVSLVRAILEFMETHPDVDLGAPGPLVHFVEQLYERGYEPELLASLRRRPVPHTIWMLHRIINGTRDARLREQYWASIAEAGKHPAADNDVRSICARLLGRHEPADRKSVV
jgi:hypothetical protein